MTFDLDAAARDWRSTLQRRGTLSPRELDELEDHLRARIELERQLGPALAADRAFAIATDDLGDTAVLAKEFDKAGMRRWRRLLVAGWAMFAASFFLPVVRFEFFGISDWLTIVPGLWEDAVTDPVAAELGIRDVLIGLGQLSPVILVHVPMFMTLPALRAARLRGERWLGWVLGAVGWSALGLGVLHLIVRLLQILVFGGLESGGFVGPAWLGPGYFAWATAFLCAAFAMRLRAREWASAAAKGGGD